MPKRKAATQLSGLVDNNDGFLSDTDNNADTAGPPAKRLRGRPKATAVKTTEVKTAKRKARSTVVVGPKRRGAKSGSAATRPQKSVETDEEIENADSLQEHGEPHDDAKGFSEDELDSPQTTTAVLQQKPEVKPVTRRGRRKAPERGIVKDGEFEYTPTGTRENKAVAKPRQTAKRSTAAVATLAVEPEGLPVNGHEEEEEEEEEEAPLEIDETAVPGHDSYESPPALSSPLKNLLRDLPGRVPTTPSQRRRTISKMDAGNESNEVMLRRKLGDATKKLESAEARYRSLREVGIVEASANVEKLRKQCESMTAASNALITSLKNELAAQHGLAKESRTLQNRLAERDNEVSNLNSKIGAMTSDLSKAQNEIKALQAKLTAARNTAANSEQSRIPGSTGKGPSSSRAIMAANAESAQALQIAQLKEDLYSDLTGLIIRDVKKRDVDYLYDCIQTGLNGSK
ncbi:predicted protein [Uncinocarpus reesii 1704]|uniref:Monopolin complex subunit Csm1/Pcs1 C-terminal domain-containing protein n=1 Tax=Uncinocarpus reesii (strain UAMH 1704) TaxID=336963 RepID=C4JH95_UNCRE|nr:uncharacterized protein UREG_02668 [Uncinocarpus reesii 1704]EEP77819.1 predicted protein [Uncinocarpus reesii 1704]